MEVGYFGGIGWLHLIRTIISQLKLTYSLKQPAQSQSQITLVWLILFQQSALKTLFTCSMSSAHAAVNGIEMAI